MFHIYSFIKKYLHLQFKLQLKYPGLSRDWHYLYIGSGFIRVFYAALFECNLIRTNAAFFFSFLHLRYDLTINITCDKGKYFGFYILLQSQRGEKNETEAD